MRLSSGSAGGRRINPFQVNVMEFVQPQKVIELIDAIFDPDVKGDPDFAMTREMMAFALLLILSRRVLAAGSSALVGMEEDGSGRRPDDAREPQS
jgi:hypothetical protein